MRKRLLFILCLIFGVGNAAFAQTKTITNADLEKYRQKRLEAEKEYRENYEKLGFPSPEELEEDRIRSQIELEILSNRLRTARLERERIDAIQEQAEAIEEQTAYLQYLNSYPLSGYQNYYYGYRPYYRPYYYPYYYPFSVTIIRPGLRTHRRHFGRRLPPIRPPRPIRPPLNRFPRRFPGRHR